jgi:TatD DNase family protein
MLIQRIAFEEQVAISEETEKPVIIHCVRAWDELLSVQKKLKPRMPWLVHGFRGNRELAGQLLAKGMYLSLWFDFALKPESGELLRSLPINRIFLATDLDLDVDELKTSLLNNFKSFFNYDSLLTTG